MRRKWTTALMAAGAAALVSYLAVRTIVDGQETLSPGDVVIDELSSAGADWVVLRNNTSREIDLGGVVFTDGDHHFVFSASAKLAAAGTITLAPQTDLDRVPVHVDYAWEGKWGIKKSGELVMLINRESDMVLDFVITPLMTEGQRLVRSPAGVGRLTGPNGVAVEQMKRPSYRVVVPGALQAAQQASLVVAGLVGFSASLTTLVLNWPKVRKKKPPDGDAPAGDRSAEAA